MTKQAGTGKIQHTVLTVFFTTTAAVEVFCMIEDGAPPLL
jgi:hypothetical protein